jgi:hypothetical protein
VISGGGELLLLVVIAATGRISMGQVMPSGSGPCCWLVKIGPCSAQIIAPTAAETTRARLQNGQTVPSLIMGGILRDRDKRGNYINAAFVQKCVYTVVRFAQALYELYRSYPHAAGGNVAEWNTRRSRPQPSHMWMTRIITARTAASASTPLAYR